MVRGLSGQLIKIPPGGHVDALVIGNIWFPVELGLGFLGGEEDIAAHEPNTVSGDEGGFFEAEESADEFTIKAKRIGKPIRNVSGREGAAKGAGPFAEVLLLGDDAVVADVVGLPDGSRVVGGQKAGVGNIAGEDGVKPVVA